FQRTPLLAELAPTPRSIENHVKMMVVDEKYWVVGGTGMAEHLCTAGDKAPEPQPARIWSQRVVAKATRDMDVIGKGAAAQTLALEFFKLWAVFDYRVKGDPDAPLVNAYKALSPELPRAEVAVFDTSPDLVHTVACKVIVCGPEHPTNACTDAYIERLQGARRSVRLGQMNVNPGPELRQALYNLPESVHCDLITTGVEGNSPVTNHFFAWTNFRHYQPLLARGAATLYEYDVPGVLYHKKVMTVDERYTLLGSYNLSQKSDCSDYELLMEIDSRRTTQRVNDVLDRDTKLSREVSPQEVQERNKLRHRILAAVQRHLLGSFIV
ncbi:MAG: phosphatidylserine/phosphatidylglycerophosphate/cardiolipin synthase family protein, partial [Chlamydiia bacterium]|nr:phosphatidylserine/phosphatidylglycerophosphate/cardiolipin synthase family protein [Chlamydiia bacterium]